MTAPNSLAAESNDSEPPRTRAAWATDRLRDALLFGDIAPGEELRETHLARAWGVSVTPLREALRQVASEGLVELQPQRVARAAPLSREHTAEVYALRLALEPAALRLSMANRPADWDLETIAALEAMHAARFTHPVVRRDLEREHRRFHLSLVAHCGSARLLETLGTLWSHSIRARSLANAGASVGSQYKLHLTLYESQAQLWMPTCFSRSSGFSPQTRSSRSSACGARWSASHSAARQTSFPDVLSRSVAVRAVDGWSLLSAP